MKRIRNLKYTAHENASFSLSNNVVFCFLTNHLMEVQSRQIQGTSFDNTYNWKNDQQYTNEKLEMKWKLNRKAIDSHRYCVLSEIESDHLSIHWNLRNYVFTNIEYKNVSLEQWFYLLSPKVLRLLPSEICLTVYSWPRVWEKSVVGGRNLIFEICLTIRFR